MTEYINSKISAFNFTIKRKRFRKFLQADVIFTILKDINSLPYDRSCTRSRNEKIADGELVLDILDIPQNINPNGTTIDFFVGRETRENYPTRDKQGNFHTRTLPEEENLCFKTHGCFLFKKIDNNWVCCLLFEKRFHTIGLSRLIKYLEKLKPDFSFDASAISTIPNIIKKIQKISNLKSVIIKDQNVEFSQDDGMGTILVKDREDREFSGLNIEIAILQGNTTLEKIKNLFVAFYKRNKEFNETTFREFALEKELVLIAKNNNGFPYKVDLFEDLILYKIKVLSLESRELDSNDFFAKTRTLLTDKKNPFDR